MNKPNLVFNYSLLQQLLHLVYIIPVQI